MKTWLFALLLPVLAFGAGEKKSASGVVIKTAAGKTIYSGSKPEAVVDTGLGENLESLVVQVNGPGSATVTFRYETSLVLRDEGPHLDLFDWKHMRSPELSADGANGKFVLPAKLDFREFPVTTTAEVAAAAKKYGSPKWESIAAQCKEIGKYPCDVVISTIEITVFRDAKKEHVIKLHPPGGC